jgi:bacterioferritin-associated ferredoxin
MYLCICNAIREKDFRSVARECPGDVDAVYAALGKAPQCGTCLDEAMHILIEERQAARPARLVANR